MSLHGAAQKVIASDGTTELIAVASTGVIYTHSFPLYLAIYFGIWVQCLSAVGTPDIKIELEQSYKLPTAEGVAETTLWVVPDSMSAVFTQINDEVAHIATVSPKPMTFGRYKITGINSNPADTTVQIYNFLQEDASN